MLKDKPLFKAIVSTANLNGVGATIMSYDFGTVGTTIGYGGAVILGTYNKYRGLSNAEEPKDFIGKFARSPAVTAALFTTAASVNFALALYEYRQAPSADAASKLCVVLAWTAALLGDNAVRRLDSVNFRKSAQQLGGSINSKLKKTFNALVANPAIFYGLTSTFFVASELVHRKDAAGNAIALTDDFKGQLFIGISTLVASGMAYAGSRTWKAAQGKISNDQINDGMTNWMAFVAKACYGGLAMASGQYGLGVAHVLYATSSLKVIYETRSALTKKKEEPTLVV